MNNPDDSSTFTLLKIKRQTFVEVGALETLVLVHNRNYFFFLD